ncbi:LolA-like outer membrane lipoprotein chaperone [Arcobacter sp. YIC-80]|uniref:LolA-like outer membrane lipoprotein chaperone n=1 Tax=unclassified Arcobacter TaxID=2593671 RepID=UPI00384E332D
MFYKTGLLLIACLIVSNASINIEKLDTYKSDFTQSIKSTTGKTIEYKGAVFIKKDGKILWKYKTPIIKNVYVLNNFVIIDEPELEQAIYTTLETEVNIIKLLEGAKKLEKNNYLANYQNVDYIIKTSNEENKIDTISYKDKLENSVTINFTDSKINVKIEDNIFKFTAPEYYDIIRK